MVGWHHRLKGDEPEQAPGDGEGQGSLVCCGPWVAESETTERHNNRWDPGGLPHRLQPRTPWEAAPPDTGIHGAEVSDSRPPDSGR